MGREKWIVSELIIKDFIRNAKGLVQPYLKIHVTVPATIVAARYFTGSMANGTYTLLNSGLPGDSLAHNVTVGHTLVSTVDTLGSILVTGIDLDNKTITETIVPVSSTTVQGVRAFKQITSLVQSGHTAVAGADSIVIGFGEIIGLPEKIGSASDVVLAACDTAIINAPTVVADAAELSKCTVLVPTGNGTKKMRVIYQVNHFGRT